MKKYYISDSYSDNTAHNQPKKSSFVRTTPSGVKIDSPKKSSVIVKSKTPSPFLNKFITMGWIFSPACLKNITANAQNTALQSENISPASGKVIFNSF